MTIDEQTAMHMGAYGLARLIVRFQRLTEQTSDMSNAESEATLASEISALAMMNQTLKAHRAS
jgi:hypothetical protein